MKYANYQGRQIDGDEGVDIREQTRGVRPDFRCCECGHPAIVMRAGGKSPAHFEHFERNDHCSLVHRPH